LFLAVSEDGTDPAHAAASDATTSRFNHPRTSVMKISLIAVSASAGLLIALTALTGCGKSNGAGADKTAQGDDAKPAAVSCMLEDEGVCMEDAPSEELGVGIACSMFKGKFVKTACPADKRIGVCNEVKDGKPNGKKVYYLGNLQAPLVDDAKKDCVENPLKPGATFAAVAGVDEAAKAAAMPQPTQITASCAMSSGEKCDDYLGKGLTDDEHTNTCKDLSGKFATTPCSGVKLVGTCRSASTASRYYAGGPSRWNAGEAKKDCEIMPGSHFFPAAGQTTPQSSPKKKTASR
jgi:hypothetical protein